MVLVETAVNPATLAAVTSNLSAVSNGAGRVIAGAINDVVTSGRAQMVRLLGEELNLKRSRIRAAFTISRATPQKLDARLRGTSKSRPNLATFGAKDTKKRGVTYRISRRGGRKRIPNAFMGRGQHASKLTGEYPQLVYTRHGKRAYKINAKKGPSINRVATEMKFDQVVTTTSSQKLDARVAARLQLLLARMK